MKYSYQQLVEDLNIGHEIEFTYGSNRVSISHNESGWYLTVFGIDIYQMFSSPSNLLEQARVEGKSIVQIWNEVEEVSIF